MDSIAHLVSFSSLSTQACLVTNPLFVAKTRLQLQRRQFAEAASNVIRNGQVTVQWRLNLGFGFCSS